ncbi:putative zinc-binding metallopeptidase [Bacteriovorax sp. Seq25_V]|uniref:anthrax toxin lethal factor-related metalloendopeptidase n=1 Tax=Bacteriovorax sp. Seq25_V TaxID=1201288 RepID=UPI00038A3AB8|nr:putative zinc-binding metallopeptidase [Bacteriovorax sp. Seq25_V]EQC43677.1 hypothetical protein M900_1326 [Bacteriovorax sp. Seq25_V]
MKKLRFICLIFLQLTSSWALESYDQPDLTNSKAAQCLPKNEDLQTYLTSKHKRTYEPIEWKGIKIQAPRTGLVQLLNRFFYSDTYKESFYSNIDIIKGYPGIETCKHEVCIADKIFGKGLGVYYFYFLDKFNFNLSPYATKFYGKDDHYENRNFFNKEELESIRAALHMLPSTVFKHYKFGTHFKKIAKYDGNVIADSALRFYNLFSDIPRNEKITTILHEIGHNISDMTAIDEHDYTHYWVSLSSWQSETTDPRDLKILDDSKNFVSNYSTSSPAEDFAESFSAYIVNPKFLEQNAPEKYRFLKDEVFKSIEYKTSNCMTRSSTSLKDILKGADPKQVTLACMDTFVDSIPTGDKLAIDKCILLNASRTQSIPLDFDLVADMSHSKEVKEYQDIIDNLISTFVTEIFKKPSYCKDYPNLAFEYKSNLFESGSNYTTHDQAENYCRWATRPLERENKELSDENIRSNFSKILKQRIF